MVMDLILYRNVEVFHARKMCFIFCYCQSNTRVGDLRGNSQAVMTLFGLVWWQFNWCIINNCIWQSLFEKGTSQVRILYITFNINTECWLIFRWRKGSWNLTYFLLVLSFIKKFNDLHSKKQILYEIKLNDLIFIPLLRTLFLRIPDQHGSKQNNCYSNILGRKKKIERIISKFGNVILLFEKR